MTRIEFDAFTWLILTFVAVAAAVGIGFLTGWPDWYGLGLLAAPPLVIMPIWAALCVAYEIGAVAFRCGYDAHSRVQPAPRLI